MDALRKCKLCAKKFLLDEKSVKMCQGGSQGAVTSVGLVHPL